MTRAPIHAASLMATALALALTACAHDATPPPARTLPLAPAWAQANNAAPDPDTAWWQHYGDARLDGLVAQALAANPDADAALARLDQARALARRAGAGRLPIGESQASVARARQSIDAGLGKLSRYVPTLARAQNEATATTGVDWDLDLAGGLRHTAQAARADALAARTGLAATRLALASAMVDAYLGYRADQALLAITEARRGALADHLRFTEARIARGESPARERDEAAASLAELDAMLAMQRAAITIDRQRIAVLAGHTPEVPFPELADAAPIPLADDPAAGLPGDMLRRRPDLVVAEAELAAAHARVGAALGEYWPHISLDGVIGIDTNTLASFGAGSSQFAQGMVGLRWRLFDFARVDAEVAAARGGERAALAAYRGAVLKASEEVESGFVALAARRAALGAQEERAAAARAAYAHSEAAERAGEISRDALRLAMLDQLQAQADVVSARLALAQALLGCHRALGG